MRLLGVGPDDPDLVKARNLLHKMGVFLHRDITFANTSCSVCDNIIPVIIISFLIHMNIMDVLSVVFVQLAVLHEENFNVGQYALIFQPSFFIPAMLKGTIDIYHFILLSVTMTLIGGQKVSRKQNLLASFSAHFSTDQDEIGCGIEAIQVEHDFVIQTEHEHGFTFE